VNLVRYASRWSQDGTRSARSQGYGRARFTEARGFRYNRITKL
jgi:hypothetical protein